MSKFGKILYIIVWSLGLLYGSFHQVFDGKLNLSFEKVLMVNCVDDFIRPMVLAMLLFLIDAIYNYLCDQKQGLVTHTAGMWMCLTMFLSFFLIILAYSKLALVAFWGAWLALTFMKGLSVFPSARYDMPDVTTPSND